MISDCLFLPNLSYFAALIPFDSVQLDICKNYQKQSFRNRTQILGSNGILDLIIPIHKSQTHCPFHEITIDYKQAWVRQHLGAIRSAYGKAPFFEYYFDYFANILEQKHDYLYQLNVALLTVCLKILNKKTEIILIKNKIESAENDYREQFHPKKSLNNYNFTAYPQLFGELFVSNLSIIDLIMNEGPHAKKYIESHPIFLNDIPVNHV